MKPGGVTELRPRIVVIGVGGAGGNAINNMIASGIEGVDFIAANTDAQALMSSSAERRIQLGVTLTEGLGAGAKPNIGEQAAEEAIGELKDAITGSHMVFIAAGMGGGTGTGATSVIAKLSREMGILTVAIVTKPFSFEGPRRMRAAEAGIAQLRGEVDTLIVIPNQNLFRIANDKTTFAEAFLLADQVLHSGIACITDLIVREGLINLDFADVRTVMAGMGTAMMGTGEAAGERRALEAAELAILNPLLDDVSLTGARGLLISISGNRSLTLYEIDEAAQRVRREVDPEADVIIGATFDETLGDKLRVSIVASGLSAVAAAEPPRVAQPAAAPAPAPAPVQAHVYAPPPPSEPAQPDWNGTYSSGGYDTWQPAPAPTEPPQTYAAASDEPVIELGAPDFGDEAPDWSGGLPYRAEEQQPEFRPRAPERAPRAAARRTAELEDFPDFAQATYKARRAPVADSPPPERRRGGLFDFWKGRSEAGEAPEPQPRPQNARPKAESASWPGEIAPHDVAEKRRLPMPRRRPS